MPRKRKFEIVTNADIALRDPDNVAWLISQLPREFYKELLKKIEETGATT